MINFAQVRYLPILASGVAAFIIGILWYGVIFGKMWRDGYGFSDAKAVELQKLASRAGAISFIGYLVTAYILSLLFGYMKISDMQTALRVTFLIWLGFPAMIELMNAQYTGRSLVVYLIDIGYQLAYLLATAALLIVLP